MELEHYDNMLFDQLILFIMDSVFTFRYLGVKDD